MQQFRSDLDMIFFLKKMIFMGRIMGMINTFRSREVCCKLVCSREDHWCSFANHPGERGLSSMILASRSPPPHPHLGEAPC